MNTHYLKSDPKPFDAVQAGLKTHEIRLNDRNFQVGDVLVLKRTRYSAQQMREEGLPLEYTGQECQRVVSHIQTGYGLAPCWCILSFELKADPATIPRTRPNLDFYLSLLRSQIVPGGYGDMSVRGLVSSDEVTFMRFCAAVATMAFHDGADKMMRAAMETGEAREARFHQVMRVALGALETARNGLEWFRDTFPDAVDGSDDEADAQIKAAIAELELHLPEPKPQADGPAQAGPAEVWP